jgi:hypothetical protein
MRNADGSFDLDANGFPKLDTTGDKVIGDQIGLDGAAGMRVNYKDFSLNVLFDTSQGNDIAEQYRYVLYGFGTHADVGEVTLTQDLKTIEVHTTTVLLRGNIADYGAAYIIR